MLARDGRRGLRLVQHSTNRLKSLCALGIAKMTVKNFYAACFKNATLARNEAGTEQAFEIRQLLRLGRVLKILVSVVRFRPWPPFLDPANRLGS